MLKSKASPGASSGSPTQAADAILPVSNMPRAAATTQPTPIPTRGPQKRSSAEPRSIMAAAHHHRHQCGQRRLLRRRPRGIVEEVEDD